MSRFLFVIATLMLFVFSQCKVLAEQESNSRKTLDATFVYHPFNRTDPPILKYSCSQGHHGEAILGSSSNLAEIFVWKDGMIVWKLGGEKLTGWYQATIPVEKIETAVQKIAEDFAKYPAKSRPTWISITLLEVGAHFSPYISVYSSQHYESFGMNRKMREFYIENSKVFQSGDEEAILKTITAIRDGMRPDKTRPKDKNAGLRSAFMFCFEDLVKFYRDEYPQAGLAEKGTTVYSDEELLKCAALYTADVEHLLLAEKTIIDLVPSTGGLKSKFRETKRRDFTIECETKDGKTEFFYNPKGVVVQSF